jgi:hypothetical protein
MNPNLIRDALRQTAPGPALRAVVMKFAGAGNSREQIIEVFEAFLSDLRSQDANNESAEDLILDTLDALHGWRHPSAALLNDERV